MLLQIQIVFNKPKWAPYKKLIVSSGPLSTHPARENSIWLHHAHVGWAVDSHLKLPWSGTELKKKSDKGANIQTETLDDLHKARRSVDQNQFKGLGKHLTVCKHSF
ncbi:hypothetical protein XENORESO_014812 [Xenotaenia resolanae]|uniref:Uncharacterized protein n=1 Tax=Xenotaenia resolanae TaxID=208358 RepID=A0ABV0W4J2_9TELE